MKAKSLAVSLALLAVLIVLSGAHALAVIVDFTDMDRGPSEKLEINGVTISSGNFGADVVSMPATVAKIGLGSATIGSIGTLDRIQDLTGYMRESLSLSVFGSLNSITIAPYFSILGSSETIFLPFDVSLSYVGVPVAYTTILSDTPIDFAIYPSAFGVVDHLQIGLQADFGNIAVMQYLHDHPGTTAQFGFSIKSLDYTPADVPEASTVLLFEIGLAGICLLRRKTIS